MVACLARALHIHGDVIRVGVATAGNDHRLGAQEAPPAIISLYTGDLMESHLKKVVEGGPLAGYGEETTTIDFGTDAVSPITANLEDRNRTAPFPFCGNRFEFRAVGSSQNISYPLSPSSNWAVAESMGVLADAIEGGKSPRDAVADMLKEHWSIIFNGDGYSDEWPVEAASARPAESEKYCGRRRDTELREEPETFSKVRVFTPPSLLPAKRSCSRNTPMIFH